MLSAIVVAQQATTAVFGIEERAATRELGVTKTTIIGEQTQ